MSGQLWLYDKVGVKGKHVIDIVAALMWCFGVMHVLSGQAGEIC